jgi:hypothetical protein
MAFENILRNLSTNCQYNNSKLIYNDGYFTQGFLKEQCIDNIVYSPYDVVNIYKELQTNKQIRKESKVDSRNVCNVCNAGIDSINVCIGDSIYTFVYCILTNIEPTITLLDDTSQLNKLKKYKTKLIENVDIIFKQKKSGSTFDELKKTISNDETSDDLYNFVCQFTKRQIVIFDQVNKLKTIYGKQYNSDKSDNENDTIWILKNNDKYKLIDTQTIETVANIMYTHKEFDTMDYGSVCKIFKMLFDSKRMTRKEMLERINTLYVL